MRTLIIHGRQPEIGRAELESLYGDKALRPIGPKATLLDLKPSQINFARLGGMVKFCKVLTTLDTTRWSDIQDFLSQTVPSHASLLPAGKLRLGISAYDMNVSAGQLKSTGLKLKKTLTAQGRSVRYIPNRTEQLNSAQVMHNKLTQKLGWELVFVRWRDKTILAQSIAVQDIEAYRRRDRERPYRDAKIGMLPPKLAQTIINLAVDGSQLSSRKPLSILDPFCGSGVILQEALLMGYQASGTDINPRMVEFAEKNLNWLLKAQAVEVEKFAVAQADAVSHTWEPFDALASEAYLGPPLSSEPADHDLNKIINDVNSFLEKALMNLSRQTKPGIRMCLAVPAWHIGSGFKRLPLLEKLDELGYNRISFKSAGDRGLIYQRPGQIVARELLVLQRR